MFYWLTELSDKISFFNVFRYITFRTGGAIVRRPTCPLASVAVAVRDRLIAAVGLGSGNSFALQNHAKKAMAARDFPEKAFPSDYVLKDLGYAKAGDRIAG